MTDLRPGSVIAGCRIDAELGRGGMGVVWRAHQLGLDRPVALKVMAPELAQDPGFRARFERESQLAASLDHPNVVPIYEAGEADGRLFLMMRLVPGTDLRARLLAHGPLPPAEALDVVAQVAGALDAAHAAGLVHRDVKPANVLLAPLGGGWHAYLSDFGLVKRTSSAGGLTGTGQWVGTVDHCAPEQIAGRPVDARADVYALACVLVQALSGQPPFPRDSDVAVMWAHMHEPPPRLSARGLPPALDAVLARGLAKDPADRPPSAGDLARAARAAVLDEAVAVPERTVARGEAAAAPPPAGPGTAPPHGATRLEPTGVLGGAGHTPPYPTPSAPTPPASPPPRRRRGPFALAAGAVLLAAAIAGGAVAVVATQDDEGPRSAAAPAPTAERTATVAPSTTERARERTAPGRTVTVPPDLRREPERTPSPGGIDAEGFTAAVPEGFTVVAVDEPAGTGGVLRRARLSGPAGTTMLLDRYPSAPQDLAAQAAENVNNLQDEPGYVEQAYGPETIGGHAAWVVAFTDADGAGTNIWANIGGDNFGVFAEGGDPQVVDRAAREVLASIETR